MTSTLSLRHALVPLLVLPAGAQSLVHLVSDPDPQFEYLNAVARVGDIDHDGVEDFAASLYDMNTGERLVRIYSGADASLIRELDGSVAGREVAGCGDVDKDGTPDLVTGYPGHAAGVGRAVVVSGATGDEIWSFFGSGPVDAFGWVVAGAGDADNDTYPDILVGAIQYSPPFNNGTGYAKLYSGLDGHEIRGWVGVNANSASFGAAVSTAGDINGDGHDDQLVADGGVGPGGTVYVYSGLDGTTLKELAPLGAGAQFGRDLAGGHDFTGDGVPDVVAGAPGVGPSLTGMVTAWSGADWSQIFTHSGQTLNAYHGGSLDVVGDVDGDGVPEVVAGAAGDDALPDAVGVVYVLSGVDGSVLSTTSSETQLLGVATNASLAALGDVTGDGLPEFALVPDMADEVRVHSTTTLPPASYCSAKPNSQGCLPTMQWSGTPSASGPDDFVLSCGDLLNNVRGALVWSTEPSTTPFMNGSLCVGLPWTVATQFFSGGTPGGVNDCSGSASFAVSQAFLGSVGVGPGEPMFFQFLYRDPPQTDGTGWGLSDGVHFVVLP